MPDIVTLTMNPALDVTTFTDKVVPTRKLRCDEPFYDAGGGGVNVAKVARVLGASAAAVYPAGGARGEQMSGLLDDDDVEEHIVPIIDDTRECFTAIDRGTGLEYRFVTPGPELTADEQEQCLAALTKVAAGAQYVVASGSFPPGVPGTFVRRIADAARDAGARFVLDSSGDALASIDSGVFLVKPSLDELCEWVGRELSTDAEKTDAARELVDRGIAEVVVVSLGADGAIMVTADDAVQVPALDVEVRSAVGAGDSMVAGLVVGLLQERSLHDALALGIACGSAALLTAGSHVCRREDIDRFDALARGL
ncbi:1-phosphofructokinase family hexose kinase [Rhodococcus artemisiae]|uniref:1-phosphofructokinase family hexose kinase n=1 Tax=Rhodococcus artemisiae TaxID=714159 RepID=A0ABU7L3P8_9NOCA|nr:1-phosphofructokinase family hexose kinase [Rhodococcus artemisiae]MEE2056176.1 1-phosphofructokinase family hexose kinase [Rhodococcus artemisiae]